MLSSLLLFALFLIPGITAATSPEEIADDLIEAHDVTDNLEQVFSNLRTSCDDLQLPKGLACVATRGRFPITLKCLKMTHDRFPNCASCVNVVINNTFYEISQSTRDASSFAKIITSIDPKDPKLLISARDKVLGRDDSVEVLEHVMAQRPEVIIDHLPTWMTCFELDISLPFVTTNAEKSLDHLTSLATESALEQALSLLGEETHYMVETVYECPMTICCVRWGKYHQNLSKKLNTFSQRVKARRTLINSLSILPSVLNALVLEYTTCDIPSHVLTPKLKASNKQRNCIIA